MVLRAIASLWFPDTCTKTRRKTEGHISSRSQFVVKIIVKNWLETYRTAFDLITDCMDKLDRYIEHRYCFVIQHSDVHKMFENTIILIMKFIHQCQKLDDF